MTAPAPVGFGLIIIGSEILDGRVRDRHFTVCRDLLIERHIPLRYTLILEDEPGLLESKLRWAMSRSDPFFCCGGIGGTPDDYTRQCAARAGGVGIVVHAEGLDMLRGRMEMTAARRRMIEFPDGSTLIPNPVNRVPGFTLGNGHFLPGFPSMAEPMMAWVLDNCYAGAPPAARHTLCLPGAREADLVDLMEAFTEAHPELAFSSLPRFVDGGTEVALSVHGPMSDAQAGLEHLVAMLDAKGVTYERQ